MSIEHALYLGQQALLTAMMIAGPPLFAGMVIGTVISMVQSITQIQEVTLVFIPKIIGVFLVIALAGPWMLQSAVAFSTEMFTGIAELPRQGAP